MFLLGCIKEKGLEELKYFQVVLFLLNGVSKIMGKRLTFSVVPGLASGSV